MNLQHSKVVFITFCLVMVIQPGINQAGQAQSDIEPLTIYITGSTIPVAIDVLPSMTTVITRKEIQFMNPHSVAQLLQSVGGLHVESAASRGGLSGIYLRGAEPNYTAVLINGVKVNDSSNSRGGAYDFSLLDINTIERIEIVKGPLSSIYGSDAMAGVINIVTAQTDRKGRVTASLDAGSRGYHGHNVLLGGAEQQSRLSLAIGIHDDGEQMEGSGFTSAAVNLTGETRMIHDSFRLAVNGLYEQARARSFPDDSGGGEYAINRQVEQRDITQQQLGIEGEQQLAGNSRLKMQLNQFQTAEQTDSPGIAGAVPAYLTQSHYLRRQWLTTYYIAATNRLDTSLGIELVREQGDNSGILDPGGMDIPTDFNLSRNVYAGFVEFQYRFSNRLRGFGGVRVDVPEEFAKETSPRLGVSYSVGQSIWRVSRSEGFKLPGFFALAHPLVGDPAFGPETSTSYELSMEHSVSESAKLTFSLFDNRYFDLIDYDAAAQRLVQRTEVTVQGLEFHWQYQYSPLLSINVSMTALDQDVVNSDAQLLKRPDRLAGIVLNWQWSSNITLTSRVNYVGAIEDSAYPTGQTTLASYVRVDTALDWQLVNKWRWQLAVDNLFNKRYEEAVGFVAPGIGLRVSLQGTF